MADKKKPSGNKSDTDRIAEIVKENMRRRELRIFHEDLERRIDIAKNGRIAYERKDFLVCVRDYKKFLSITARAYQVDLKDLHPKLFAENVRATEGLLIASVALDLIKIYDHLESPASASDRALYFKLLVAFTKNMPYQSYMIVGVDRYIKYTSGIKHKKEFTTAWKAMGGGSACFVATAVYGSENTKELTVLRKFRDDILLENFAGRSFVAAYYKIGPSAAALVKKNRPLKSAAKILLDKIVKQLS